MPRWGFRQSRSPPGGAPARGGRLTDDQAVTEVSVMRGVLHGNRGRKKSGTHRVMTGLFLELAGRLPVLSHGHQSHRERRWTVAGVLFDCLCVSVAQVSRHALFKAQGQGKGWWCWGRPAGLVMVGEVFCLWTA